MHLKNQGKSQLGRYVEKLDSKPENHFIGFFKEVYPEKQRRKEKRYYSSDQTVFKSLQQNVHNIKEVFGLMP